MNAKTPVLAVCLTLVAAAPSLSAQADALAVLESAAERYRASSGVCADFEQELRSPLLGETTRGHGRLCLSPPNLFSLRFSDPDGDRIIVDGETVWTYLPSLDSGLAYRQAVGSRTVDFKQAFLEDPATKYEARLDGLETLDGSTVHRVVLVPRQETGYEEAVLWIDASTSVVRQVTTTEENGNVRRLSMTAIDMAAAPPADTYRFQAPAGVEIVPLGPG